MIACVNGRLDSFKNSNASRHCVWTSENIGEVEEGTFWRRCNHQNSPDEGVYTRIWVNYTGPAENDTVRNNTVFGGKTGNLTCLPQLEKI